MNISRTGKFENIIQVEETFRAPKDKVFKAWTTPSSLKNWFMADEGVTVLAAEVDLQPEGAYFIEVLYPGYDPTRIDGKFLHIVTTEELDYTWTTPVLDGIITKVEVKFLPNETGSKILLTHGQFETEEQIDLHIKGWKGCLGRLHEFLEQS